MYDSYEEYQRNDARQVIRSLALGVDPDSGGRLKSCSTLGSPTIIRALFLAIEALTDHDIPPKPDTTQEHLSRAGMPWLAAEDEQLRSEFKSGINLILIAEFHQRTQGSIAARLVHLKLASSRDEVRDLLAWS